MEINEKEDKIISVIIPCRNENIYIRDTILSILDQKLERYSLEIIVVDGMSQDGTREILYDLSSNNKNIRIFDNPARITPVALNIGIRNSVGKYVAILGAHAEISDDYFKLNLELMDRLPDVSCTGGPIISRGKNDFAKAAAISMSSFIGVGNAKHRFPEYEGYAEMACFPFFRRDVFDKYGFYDESLIKNQDDEYCFRIRLNGEKIFLSNRVKSIYYVRDSVSKLFSQYYSYGKWRIPVLIKHKIPISYRQQVPAIFFALIIIFFALSLLIGNYSIGLFLPATYIIILCGFAISNLRKEKLSVIKYLPVTIFILHFSYALGFISGILHFGTRKFN
jgi:glycosyltransferase involved in cell wall biosynthesis